MAREGGFTIIELIIVIVIIGILLTIGVLNPIRAMVDARDSERADDIASIARKLEQDYQDQVTGGPSYPSTAQFIPDTQNGTGTAAGTGSAIYTAPGATGPSVVAATSSSTTDPAGPNTPLLDTYVYQPITSTGGLCDQTSETCVRFNLYYRLEGDNSVPPPVRSLHQQ